ncbi:MAG: hypothetical protein JW929_06555 [Anaerolineales bacterium]|nr:hypothetical protein [Anaerolineales bacterium]
MTPAGKGDGIIPENRSRAGPSLEVAAAVASQAAIRPVRRMIESLRSFGGFLSR